jgi:hypothetical protein
MLKTLKATPNAGRANSYGSPEFHNRQVIRIKPIADIYLDLPEPDERCCIVWDSFGRRLKFIDRSCPNHGRVECLTEYAY